MTAAACWHAAHGRLPPETTAILDSSNEPALTNLVLVAASPEWEVPLRGVRDRHLETYSRLSVTNVV